MVKSTATKKIISIFLCNIIVIGTITAVFFPSISMTQVNALSENGGVMMEDGSNYETSKYSLFKKDNIECNNFNLNLNGLEVNAIPESLSSLLQAQAETEAEDVRTFGNNAERDGDYQQDKNFSFTCINNNDNEFIIPPSSSVNDLCTVWEHEVPDTSEIFFSGSHDGGETFTTPLNISKDIEGSFQAQIKCDGNNVYVVWEGITNNTAGFTDIFFSFSHDGGQTFSEPDNLSENNGTSSNSQIVSEGNNVYVVWVGFTSSNFETFFARSTNGGQTFSEPEIISEGTGVPRNPQISSEGNNVYVVWSEDFSETFFARSTNGGQTFSEPEIISDDIDFSIRPQISSEGNNVYVVWEGVIPDLNAEIFFARSTNGGQTFSVPDNLSETARTESAVQISSEGNNVYVVWSEDGSEILFARSTNGGQTFSVPDNISESTGLSNFPQISSNGNNIYVVWPDDTFGNNDIFFSFSHNSGQTFSVPDNISESTGIESAVQISSDGNNVYVIWQDVNVDIGNSDIFFTFSHNGGQTFSTPPDNLSNSIGFSRNPQISSTTS